MKIAFVLAGLLAASSTIFAQSTVTNLQVQARDGQVFLTWQEPEIPEEALFTVYFSKNPITDANLKDARILATRIHKSSARNWWLDPRSFDMKKEAPAEQTGFIIRNGDLPLDPASGLHVHTVTPETAGLAHFAVTWTMPGEIPHNSIVPKVNTTSCQAASGQVCPVFNAKGSSPLLRGCAKDYATEIVLHGRGGGQGNSNSKYIWFGSAAQGWREGLPALFALNIDNQRKIVRIVPHDRTWVNRPVLESSDSRDYCKAINTWWLGYNVNIAESTVTNPEIVVDNYSQKVLLALLDWSQNWLGCDPNRAYLTGGSMGGSASVALALQFPRRFAAVHALVPVYTYNWNSCKTSRALTAGRLACACGPLKRIPARLTDGRNLLEYMDGVRNVASPEDMPPIFATNGRRDPSIPWVNNPPFYKAANDARQAFAVFWNNGDHGMSGTAPEDVKAWASYKYKYALNKSFPAFSNSSDSRNYGKGDPEDGDSVGWLNRGFDWQDAKESEKSYSITLEARHPGIAYPVTADVTFRRRQAFRPEPGTPLNVNINGQERTMNMPADGLLTVTGLVFQNAEPVVITITR